nr:hypothetical protein [Tanacetum cinerariifolium]
MSGSTFGGFLKTRGTSFVNELPKRVGEGVLAREVPSSFPSSSSSSSSSSLRLDELLQLNAAGSSFYCQYKSFYCWLKKLLLIYPIQLSFNKPSKIFQEGINKWYKSLLRNFRKEEHYIYTRSHCQREDGITIKTTQTVSALKLPMLKTGDYDLWSMRMEQYLTHTHYALWEVIVNSDAPVAIASVSGGAEAAIPPKTTKQKRAKKNEVKAKTTLLLAILDEHLLKFHGIKDANTYRKQLRPCLGKTYDRFQKLISQLEIHGEVISPEDANPKLLRSLPPAWNTHTLIMRNKYDIDTLSMDDLYNKLKVNEAEIKSQSSSGSNFQNGEAFALTYADDVMFSLFANQSNSGHTYHEGEEIHKEDKKQSKFKWAPRNQENRNGDNTIMVVLVETPANALVVTDGMGYDWSYQAEEGPTNFALNL